MIRQVIKIDEDKCTGCGICANACHEGAIGIVDGKAKLLRDDYCDGMGDCLPTCPAGAISFENREAAAYSEEAVKEHKQAKEQLKEQLKVQTAAKPVHAGGCPGEKIRIMNRSAADKPASAEKAESQLQNWPVQIKLAPLQAPYYDNAKLLIAADCTAYAYASFHRDFIRGKVTLIGCPKLDAVDYSQKLTSIIQNNNIQSVTIVRMEVPCCGGLEYAAKKALQASGKFIPWQVVTIGIDGTILD